MVVSEKKTKDFLGKVKVLSSVELIEVVVGLHEILDAQAPPNLAFLSNGSIGRHGQSARCINA